MSEKYKFYGPQGMYFVTMATVGWVDVLFPRSVSRFEDSAPNWRKRPACAMNSLVEEKKKMKGYKNKFDVQRSHR